MATDTRYGLDVAAKTKIITAADYAVLLAAGTPATPGTIVIDPITNAVLGIVNYLGALSGVGLTSAQLNELSNATSPPEQIVANLTITATNAQHYNNLPIELTGAYSVTINAGATAAGFYGFPIIMAPASAGTLVSDGTTTFNGATTTITMAAGSLYSVMARGSAANQFVVKGS